MTNKTGRHPLFDPKSLLNVNRRRFRSGSKIRGLFDRIIYERRRFTKLAASGTLSAKNGDQSASKDPFPLAAHGTTAGIRAVYKVGPITKSVSLFPEATITALVGTKNEVNTLDVTVKVPENVPIGSEYQVFLLAPEILTALAKHASLSSVQEVDSKLQLQRVLNAESLNAIGELERVIRSVPEIRVLSSDPYGMKFSWPIGMDMPPWPASFHVIAVIEPKESSEKE